MLVGLTTVTWVAAAPPTVTAEPAEKLAPVRVTTVPPSVVPEAGETLVTRGAVGDDGPTPGPPHAPRSSVISRPRDGSAGRIDLTGDTVTSGFWKSRSYLDFHTPPPSVGIFQG